MEEFVLKIVKMVNSSWVEWENERGCFSFSKGAIFPVIDIVGSWALCQTTFGNRFWIKIDSKVKVTSPLELAS